ncbi:uncharacterized protein LOC114438607 [Parambassis ranga]|uniref:Uncharacterized protein LOC114438607 n=1 Tax=Parambassis ranga TaxID=210632 RepID=A0A6P7IK01_9TELE|nr:uncharacterized protein LOC114438607 [Parambassis ranga]
MEDASLGLHHYQSNTQDNLQPSKVLVTTFKDKTEVAKNIFHVNSAKDLIDQSLAQQTGCVLDRLLKYNTDFMKYIDVDMNEEELKDLDRYHIFLSTQGTQVECVEANQNQAQPHTEGAGGQWETEPSASEACQSGPLEKCQGENDGVHRFDAANLVVLINNKAPSVLAEYEKSGTLSLASRKLLVRTGVSDLVERRGFYPSNADKLMLAKSITTIFPSLKIKIQEANEGFEHFYDPVSHCGFIELKLRNCGETFMKIRDAIANAESPVRLLE